MMRRWRLPGGWRAAALLGAAMLALVSASCGAIPVQPRPLSGEGLPPGYIGGGIPSQYRGMKNPFTLNDSAALGAGATVYASLKYSCASCHGVSGRGDGPMALYIDYGPADFSAPPMLAAFRDHQDYAYWWVADGVTKTEMPSHTDQLSETQIWQAITYAWYLGQTSATSRLSADEGPSRASNRSYRR